ncbi:MAG: MFS transporter [Pseudomonadota bacterium]
MAGLAAMAVAYILSQFFRSFLAVIAPTLTAELGAGAAALGTASGAWFLAFAAMQIPVGLALDRIGPRRTASVVFGLGAGGGAALFAAAQGEAQIIAAMAVIGAGCAPAMVASLYIFARAFDPARFAFLTSMLVGVGTAVGNLGAAAPLAWAAEAYGWRAAMGGLAAAALAVAGLAYALLRDPPRADGADGDAGLRELASILRLPGLWPILALAFATYMAPAGIRGLWAGPWFAEVHGLGLGPIGDLTTLMALGMAAGAFAYGPLDRWLNTRKWVNATGNALTAACCAAFALLPAVGVATGAAFFVAIGALGMSYGVVMAHGRALLLPHLVGRGVTLLTFVSMSGVGVGQAVTGRLADRFVADDPAQGFTAVFAFYAAALALATLVYLTSRDAPPLAEARSATSHPGAKGSQ